MRRLLRKQAGFTLVELLVVIVIISILATISIITYSGIQERARDSARKSDIAALSKTLNLYFANNTSYLVNSGCGGGTGGSGDGWIGLDFDGAGPQKSTMQCILDSGIIDKEIVDPSGTISCATGTICRAYAIANCIQGSPSGIYLLASLEGKPQDATALDGTCHPTWDSDFGLNYVVRVY